MPEFGKIGFIGAGQMAEALARGFCNGKMIKFEDVVATDPTEARMKVFKDLGASTVTENKQVVEKADVIFIAVKPQYVGVVLKEVRGSLRENHTIVSIAAGVTLAQLKEAAGDVRLVRVMPNTPCLVGETASAMCLGPKATDKDAEIVKKLFSTVGQCIQVDESLLSAVTGLSGSGPAYVFLMIEALSDGGVRAGLPRDIAQALAAQTVLGSAKMVTETGKHPGQLKDMVTSPAGTTIAGVHELEKGAFRSTVMNAVLAAANRANELANQ